MGITATLPPRDDESCILADGREDGALLAPLDASETGSAATPSKAGSVLTVTPLTKGRGGQGFKKQQNSNDFIGEIVVSSSVPDLKRKVGRLGSIDEGASSGVDMDKQGELLWKELSSNDGTASKRIRSCGGGMSPSSQSAEQSPALQSQIDGAPLEAGPPSPLEIVKDFGYQGKVWRTIERLIEKGGPTSMLSIQPTSSGKGRYAILLSQRPGKLATPAYAGHFVV